MRYDMKDVNGEFDILELQTMIVGGVYYKRLPGRGIAIRREYRPLSEAMAEGMSYFSKAITDMAVSLNKTMIEIRKFYDSDYIKGLRSELVSIFEDQQSAGSQNVDNNRDHSMLN